MSTERDMLIAAALRFLEAEDANFAAVCAEPPDMQRERVTERELEAAREHLLNVSAIYRDSLK